MSVSIIDKETYYQRKIGCTTPDRIQAGLFFIELNKLRASREEAFAQELLVRILSKKDKDGYSRIRLSELSDDGNDLTEKEINVAPDGVIVRQGCEPDFEAGYLLGRMEPRADGFNITKEEMLVPVRFQIGVRIMEKVMQRALPSA